MTLRRCLLHALLLAVCAPAPLLAQEPALMPSSEAGFQRLTDAIASGGMGTGVTLENVAIAADRARLELHAPGRTWSVTLTRPQQAQASPRWFALAAEPPTAAFDRPALSRLLDAAFPTDPWTAPRPPKLQRRFHSFIENFQDDRASGRTPRFEGTASAGYLLGALIAIATALAALLWSLVSTRPDRP